MIISLCKEIYGFLLYFGGDYENEAKDENTDDLGHDSFFWLWTLLL